VCACVQMEQQQATQSNSARLHALRYKDYGFPSHTSIQQGVTENRVAPFFTDAKLDPEKRASYVVPLAMHAALD